MTDTPYSKLRSIDVGAKLEQKNGLSYLSWPFAIDTLFQHDAEASWHYNEEKHYGDTLMVSCTVKAFGKERTAQLPVMDHRNKAIASPDAFAVNTAMQRCLVKAIALHGLGLYVYAGEDLPAAPDNTVNPRGDLGKDTDKREADALATTMRETLDEDVDDDIKALRVADIHDGIKNKADLYVAASDRLTAAQRTGWKAYVKMAADAARREPMAANGRGR